MDFDAAISITLKALKDEEAANYGYDLHSPNRNSQSVPAGGFCFTIAGKQMLAQLDGNDIVILQPGSLAQSLSTCTARSGQRRPQLRLDINLESVLDAVQF